MLQAIIEQRAKDRGIQIQFCSKKEGLRYPFIYGSPVHLRQIFLNIYGNCIKYNRIGGKIRTVSDYTEAVDIGMSREYQEHIFEPFSQESEDARSTQQGIGLGMAIVKGLIEKMGGTIEVKSEEGIGSTFIIRIPFKLAPAPDTVKKTAAQMDISGLNLLLVEDNELNAEIAETLLSDEGANLTVAEDGLQAVRMFQEKPEGYFDAILMDIMMPVMDGITATKTIRSLKHPDAETIPIIAMTANAFREDKEKCLAAGMNAHLAKPIKIENIKRILCEYCV